MKTQRKKDSPHRAISTRTKKEIVLKALARGLAPAQAAARANVARSTVYMWKKDDQEFDTRWVDAVESSLDKLETVLYKSAASGKDPSNLQFALKWRRRNTYNNVDADRPQQTNLTVNVTLQEQLKRLERLGLPVPVIESDYEIIDDAGEDHRDP